MWFFKIILLASDKIREHLLEGSDFKIINETGWNRLVQWFGIIEGQEPLKRIVIEHGIFRKEAKVEIYPLQLNLCLTSVDSEEIEMPITDQPEADAEEEDQSFAKHKEFIHTAMNERLGVGQSW